MEILLAGFAAGLLLEVGLRAPGLWRARHVLAGVAVVLIAGATGGLLAWELNAWTMLITLASLYRIFNLFRLLKGRMHEQYLRRATLRTSLILVGLQALAVGAWWLWLQWHETGQVLWTVIALAQLGAAVVLVTSTTRRLQRTAWPSRVPAFSDVQLPTLTVAIPARNETEDLQACLESLVQSDYPKLEILVLDDCSQTKRTPEIIRNFAHDGVRFLEGEPPKQNWLAKNQAYEHLLREANGAYILFCGVDVRFAPHSLRQLVAMTLHKDKEMLCLLPWRAAGAERRFAVVQAMRYFWELAPPRRLFRRPPVLSTCWIAKTAAIPRSGGFAAVKRAIVPEAHFARVLTAHDTYSFMRASQALGIESTKPAREQHDTAIRMRYPQLHRRPENVFLLALAYGFFMLLPFVLLVAGFWIAIGLTAHLLVVATVVLLTITYFSVTVATRTGSRLLGLVALPMGLVHDMVLVHRSMWQYEFSIVEWKGRNVCIPTMHVYPHLPRV